MTDFVRLLARLSECQVAFVLVGGLAAAAHGCSLVTQDIDICVDLELGNLLRLQTALQDLHPVHRMTPRRLPFQHDPPTLVQFRNLYLDTDWGQLDCLGEVKGLGSFPEVLGRSEVIELHGQPCRILTLPALLQTKEALDRPRDAEAVRQLRAIQARRS